MGIRKAFPGSAKQKLSISIAGVAPEVNNICDGLNDTLPPMIPVMKFAIACRKKHIKKILGNQARSDSYVEIMTAGCILFSYTELLVHYNRDQI